MRLYRNLFILLTSSILITDYLFSVTNATNSDLFVMALMVISVVILWDYADWKKV